MRFSMTEEILQN